MSDYQPRQQGGWPQQPPPQNGGGQGSNGQQQGAYGQQGSFGQSGQDSYGQSGQDSYGQSGQGSFGQSGQDSYGQQSPGQQSPGQGWTPQGYAQAQPSRRRRKRRHPVRWLIITLVVILAILGIGDQVAKAVAEDQVAQKIESSGLNVKPSVNIEGWPFLTQLVAKDLKAIDISTGPITEGKYQITSIHARATGVHLSSLSSNASAEVDNITGTATISFSSLNNDLGNAVGISGAVTVSADPAAGPNAIQVTALGGLGTVTAQVEHPAQNEIVIHFGSASGLASLLNGSGAIQDQVINIPKLPAGLVVKSITVTSQGIVATASASHTTLSQ